MDFDKPLPKVEGYLLYSTLLDYVDTFIHEYMKSTNGKECPSLRMTTDMFLSLLMEFKSIDSADLNGHEDLSVAREELELRLLAASEKSEADTVDSRKIGLFIDECNEENVMRTIKESKEEPLKPLTISSKKDKDWLRKCGISGD